MSALYDVALFIHVFGVTSIFAAIGIEMSNLLLLRRSTTAREAARWAQAALYTDRIFPVSTILIVLAGLYMANAAWGWTTGWIDVALVVFVVIAIEGPAVHSRRTHAILKLARSEPPDAMSPELSRRILDRTLITSMTIATVTMVGIVLLMTMKPGWTASVAIILASVLAGFLLTGMVTGRVPVAGAAGEAPAE